MILTLKGAFSRYTPIMADRVTRRDGIVLVYRDSNIVYEFDRDLITAFGGRDITYPITGEI